MKCFYIASGIAVSVFAAVPAALAADVSYGAKLEQRFEYDDNTGLSVTAPNETAASVTSPAFILRTDTPTSRTSLTGQFDLGRYWHDSRFNYEDVTGALDTAYMGLRSELGLRADVARLSTLQSELTDTGLVDLSGHRLDLSAAPYWSYRVTQRGTIRLDADFRRVHYTDTLLLDDYRTYGGGIGYSYALSELDSLGFRTRYSHYDNLDVPLNESDSYSGLVVWSRDITDRLQSELSVGPQFTRRTDNLGVTSDKWGVTVGGNLDWRASELTRLKGAISRAVEPSGLGNTTERNKVSFDASYRATQLVTLRLSSYYQRDNYSSTSGLPDRDYFTASPSLNWQFARNWWFSTGYRYRWQQYNGAGSATSNMAFISISVNTSGWNAAN